MTRSGLLLALIGAVGLLAGRPAQAQTQDKVIFYDHAQKKEDSLSGTIEAESAAGIKIKVGGAVKEVPALDVRSVTYRSKVFGVTDFRQDGKEDRAAMPSTKPEDRKRLLREAFRLRCHELPEGLDFVLIPVNARGATLADFEAELVRAARKLESRVRAERTGPGTGLIL